MALCVRFWGVRVRSRSVSLNSGCQVTLNCQQMLEAVCDGLTSTIAQSFFSRNSTEGRGTTTGTYC